MTKQNRRFAYQDIFKNQTNKCDHSSDVLEYFEKVMPENSRSDFERHLAGCDQCTDELAALEDTVNMSRMTAVDAAKADEILQRGRSNLEAHLQQKYGSVAAPRSPGIPFSGFRLPAYTSAILAGLLLVLIYPAYKGFVLETQVQQLQHQLSQAESQGDQPDEMLTKSYEERIQQLETENANLGQPSASMSEIRSVRTERDASGRTVEVQFNSTTKTRDLTFSIEGGFEHYRVEISRGADTIWTQNVPGSSDSQFALISVHLPANFFIEGQYRLALYGVDQSGSRRLGEFTLRVKAS